LVEVERIENLTHAEGEDVAEDAQEASSQQDPESDSEE
jgi:hypothetical protein